MGNARYWPIPDRLLSSAQSEKSDALVGARSSRFRPKSDALRFQRPTLKRTFGASVPGPFLGSDATRAVETERRPHLAETSSIKIRPLLRSDRCDEVVGWKYASPNFQTFGRVRM